MMVPHGWMSNLDVELTATTGGIIFSTTHGECDGDLMVYNMII
jgi:hypothetical protein